MDRRGEGRPIAEQAAGRRAAPWLGARWRRLPGLLALAIVVALEAAVNDALTLNGLLDTLYPDLVEVDAGPAPFWEQPTLWLAGAAIFCWVIGWWRPLRWLTIAANAFATVSALVLVAALAATVVQRRGAAGATGLLLDAVMVWAMLGLVYAIWYWLLDGGGPMRRAEGAWRPDLIFPQQQQAVPGWEGWRPSFLDNLGVSFLINVTFNSGSTFLFARWALALSIVQALQAIVLILFLAARAIGAFGG